MSESCNAESHNDLPHSDVRLAHNLPTTHDLDPDLAYIVGAWDGLADEIKARLIAIVQESHQPED
jgi:hypothetical protein